MLTEAQAIAIAFTDGVTRARCPTLRAPGYPAVVAALPAYGTRLQGIVFYFVIRYGVVGQLMATADFAIGTRWESRP
jgi:hypothetical protein